MSTAYTIVKATSAHGDLLAALAATTFRDAFVKDLPAGELDRYVRETFTIPLMSEALSGSDVYIFILYDGDDAAGYARLSEAPGPVPVPDAVALDRLYVRKEYMGLGGGKALMEHCLRFAADNGFRNMWLGVWQGNERAIRFYERYGFEKYGTKKFKLGRIFTDDYLMKRAISE